MSVSGTSRRVSLKVFASSSARVRSRGACSASSVATARAGLGEAAFAVAWAEGRAMSLDEEDFQRVLIRYASERLLYRLSRSEHRDSFILKGAALRLEAP